MKQLLVSLAAALLFLCFFCASAQSFQNGDIIEAVFTVTDNPNNAVAAAVVLDYDSSCLEWLPSHDFTSNGHTSILFDLNGIQTGTTLSASFKLLSQQSTNISLSTRNAYDINEKTVPGPRFSNYELKIRHIPPCFLLSTTDIESAANDLFASVSEWRNESDVLYKNFSDFPISLSSDFFDTGDFKKALNAANDEFSLAYSFASNIMQPAAQNVLPSGFDIKYEVTTTNDIKVHIIHYQSGDCSIRWKTEPGLDRVCVHIHCGNISRRLFYSGTDLRLLFFS